MDLTTLQQQTAELLETSEAMLDSAEKLHAHSSAQHDKHAANARAILASAKLDSLAALIEKIGSAKTRHEQAEKEYTIAAAQIEPAQDLDRRISTGTSFLDTVDELRTLLADAKFVSHVVEQKQEALLAVASRLLSDMTSGRFGFSPDFQVVDKLAGEARSPDTLSGGETFLASLALALGLTELAGRSGGRLDAIFLDEGFGSLDADSLERAINALMDQAESGRLVVVISHIQAVAENIEDVLYVVSRPTGSEVRWLDLEDRSKFDREPMGLLS